MKTKKKSEYPKNLICLDFDGCVTSYRYGSYVTSSPKKYGFDPVIVKRLKELCIKTNSKILITSNWRKFDDNESFTFGRKTVMNPLPKLKKELGNLYFDTIPPLRHVRKPFALREWFINNPEFKGNFAILEDNPQEGYHIDVDFKEHLFMCNARYGMTIKISKEIEKFFV